MKGIVFAGGSGTRLYPITKEIDGRVPAILQSDALHKTVEIPSAGLVNINPQNVHNYNKDDN